jgi:hypothetical protein
MDSPGRNVAALSRSIRSDSAVHGQCHLSFENDVRCLCGVDMVGIVAARSVLPDIGVPKAFAVQLFFEFRKVHDGVLGFAKEVTRIVIEVA